MLAKGLQSFFNQVPATLTAMFIFLSVFVAVSLYVIWRKEAQAFYERLAQIPFTIDEENQNGK